jgi:hypothetical protein
MPRRPLTPPGAGDFDFHSTSGQTTGFSGLTLAVAGLVWVLTTVHTAVGVRLALAFALFGVLSYAFMLRPKVHVTSGVLHLVNPFETTAIPLALVSRVTVRSATHVQVDQKRYIGVAVGRKTREMARPRGEAGGMASPFGLGVGRLTSNTASTTERVPDLLEEYVGTLARDAARESGDPSLVVRRDWTWWLIAPAAALAVALVVSFLLG